MSERHTITIELNGEQWTVELNNAREGRLTKADEEPFRAHGVPYEVDSVWICQPGRPDDFRYGTVPRGCPDLPCWVLGANYGDGIIASDPAPIGFSRTDGGGGPLRHPTIGGVRKLRARVHVLGHQITEDDQLAAAEHADDRDRDAIQDRWDQHRRAYHLLKIAERAWTRGVRIEVPYSDGRWLAENAYPIPVTVWTNIGRTSADQHQTLVTRQGFQHRPEGRQWANMRTDR